MWDDLGITGNALHLDLVFDINDANSVDCPNGTWTASNEANRFSYNSATDTYTKISPYYFLQ
jgi:hypothetical protein